MSYAYQGAFRKDIEYDDYVYGGEMTQEEISMFNSMNFIIESIYFVQIVLKFFTEY